MALTQGSKVIWSDVSAIYTKLNTARSKWGYSTVSDPARTNQLARASDVSTLSDFVNEMRGNAKVAAGIGAISEKPTVGTLLKPFYLNNLSTDIDTIQAICNFGNSSWGDSSWGFGNSSFGNSSFGDSGFSFGQSSFGNSGWGNSGFSQSSWGNSSWGNSSWGNSSWSQCSWGNSSFGDSSWSFGNSSWSFGFCSGWNASDPGFGFWDTSDYFT